MRGFIKNMIKYILAIILIYASYTLSRRYVAALYERLEYEIAILDFFEFIRDKMRATYAPVSKIAALFSSPPLENAGFLPLGAKKNIHSAFLSSEELSRIDREVYEAAASILSKIGTGDIDSELSRLDEGCACIAARVGFLKEEHKKREKVALTLSLGISLGIVILLL